MPVPDQVATPPAERDVSPLVDLLQYTIDHERRAGIGPAAEPERAAAEPEPSPATAEAPPVQAEGGDWWETGLAEAKHGFLKGKKGEEVETAFRYTEQAKKDAEIRAKAAERQLRELEAERAAEKIAAAKAAPTTPPAPTSDEDPRMAEVRDIFYSDTPKALKLLREIAADDAAREFDKRESAREAKRQAEERGRSFISAADEAVKKISVDSGLPETAVRSLVHGSLHHLQEYIDRDPSVLASPDSYLWAYRQQHGEPAQLRTSLTPQAEVPPPPKEAPDPPGAKGAAPPTKRAATQSNVDVSVASERRLAAEQLGLSKEATERFVNRARK